MGGARPTAARGRQAPRLAHHPAAFAALGDATRCALVARLRDGEALPITRLARGLRLSRQAVTKHLRVLEQAGLVRGERHGREVRFALEPQQISELRSWLDGILGQWQESLGHLRAHLAAPAGRLRCPPLVRAGRG
jgi:DNA-binding transcriptional ArsR family regulator